MTALEQRRKRDRNQKREQYQAKLARARRGRRTCPRRAGAGTCGGILEDRVLPGGRVEVVCELCRRLELGVCRGCTNPVDGQVRRAVWCAECRVLAGRRQAYAYRKRHAEADRRRRALYRQRNPEKVAAQKRRWRERNPLKVAAHRRATRLKRQAA